LLHLQGTTSPANGQLRAVSAFIRRILATSNVSAKGIVPDLLPIVGEDVAEGFKVALAGDDFSVWLDCHGDMASTAALHAQL
jgi:hypothetical protein